MSTEFVGERIEPVKETLDASRMARGEPGLPRRFRWRGEEHEVAAVIETWKTTGDCTHGSREQYVRKHWFRVRTTAGSEMKISFDRQARTPRELRDAWWLHSISSSPGGTSRGAKNPSDCGPGAGESPTGMQVADAARGVETL